MTSLKVKTINPSKKSRLIQKIGFGFLVVGASFVALYAGYCWGLWGRSSLLLQYLFQCKCPISSTEFRYPEQIDVILTTCQYDTFILSPSGRFLYVEKRESGNNRGYFWNLQTDEKHPYTIPDGDRYFLDDDLLFLRLDYEGEYILDRTTGIQYPIQSIDTYTENQENINHILKRIKSSQKVFYIESYNVVSIVENFRINPEGNFIVYYDIPGKTTNEKEKFLQENNITYTLIPRLAFSLDETISPDGRFLARRDGIYLFEINKKIINSHNGLETYIENSDRNFSLYGWVYDNTGVIYAEPRTFGLCLIRYWFPLMDGSNCLIQVPQPVLLLKVPQEYLDTP